MHITVNVWFTGGNIDVYVTYSSGLSRCYEIIVLSLALNCFVIVLMHLNHVTDCMNQSNTVINKERLDIDGRAKFPVTQLFSYTNYLHGVEFLLRRW